MKKINAFSLMEMMVVLLIISIVAAATAPMINRKMLTKASDTSPWVWTGLNNDITYNLNANTSTASIGAIQPPLGSGHPRLYIETKDDNPLIHFRYKKGRATTEAKMQICKQSIALTTDTSTANIASNSVLIGIGATSSNQANSTAIGYNAKTTGAGSVAIGSNSTTAANYSVALGHDAKANHVDGESTALGYASNALNKATTAVGYLSSATANFATALGRSAKASGEGSISIGSPRDVKNAKGKWTTNLGAPSASGTFSIAIGSNAASSATNTIAIGPSANASSEGAIAIGVLDTADNNTLMASAPRAIAIGHYAKASGNNSIALGSGANASAVEGNTLWASANKATAIGYSANASGSYSTALGSGTAALNEASTAIGYSANASGYKSTALGSHATASNSSSIAIGPSANALNLNSTAIGHSARATGNYSTAIGYGANTQKDNEIRIGTGSSTVYIPGNLVVGKYVLLNVDAETNNSYRTFIKMRDANRTHGGSIAIRSIGHLNSGLSAGVGVEAEYNNVLNDKYSDRRLKNVGKAFVGGLEQIRKLQVFNYTFKDDKSKTPRVGVMAQDLQKIFPDAVIKGEDGFLRIRMEDMFYALVNAVKQNDQRITELEKQNKELIKKNQELLKRVSALEKKIK